MPIGRGLADAFGSQPATTPEAMTADETRPTLASVVWSVLLAGAVYGVLRILYLLVHS